MNQRHLFEVPETTTNCIAILTRYEDEGNSTAHLDVIPVKNATVKPVTIAELFAAFVAEVCAMKSNKSKDVYEETLLIAIEACLAPVEELRSLVKCMINHISTVDELLESNSEKDIIAEFKTMKSDME